MHGVGHEVINGFVCPTEGDAGRQDGEGAIGWVGGRPSVREKVGLEWGQVVGEKQAAIVLAKSVAPELFVYPHQKV